MHDKNDKRYLYDLIDNYLDDKIDETVLCDGMYYSFVHEIDNSTLTDTELEVFSSLERITSRFSEFEEDYKIAPNAYYTRKDIKQAVIEANKKLKRSKLE